MSEQTFTVPQIVEATGLSRATVYRRLKSGELPTEIMGDKAPVAEAPEMMAEDVSTKEWCEAVKWAVQHANTKKMTQRRAGSLLKFSLWQLAQDNPRELICKLMPDALVRLDKLRKEEMEGDVSEAERPAVAELDELLIAAMAEAGV